MKIVRESLFEEEEFKWIKGPTQEQVRARLEPKLKGMTLKEKFDLAVNKGLVWLLQECIDAGYDPSSINNWAIKFASEYGYTEIVKLFLSDRRVDPSCENNYPCTIACHNGYIEIVKLLIQDNRVDPSAYENRAIQSASNTEHDEIVKELLSDKRVRNKLNFYLRSKYKEFLKQYE